uniref:Uncharacterized protein n=1 Tax=Micrurus lemniscatus lemniscatus TaxID=129467 RepID=A0A2D4IUV0_MICLE
MDQRHFIIHKKMFTDAEMQHLEKLAKKKTSNDKQAEEIVPTPEKTDQPAEETNIQVEDPPVQQLKTVELTDLAKMQKVEIENHIKENTERKCLPFAKYIANQ